MTPDLSPMQARVLAGLANGHTYEHIGDTWGITRGTVKAHRLAALRNLGVRTATHAVALAIAYDLIPASTALPVEATP